MVFVKDYHLREGEKGTYVSLELMGDIELVQSQNTGRFYATARRCFMLSTFDEATAQLLIGKEIPGHIVRVQSEQPYDFTLESGEVISLSHRYEYVPPKELKSVPPRKELKPESVSKRGSRKQSA
jgi:hypothetical protein